MDSRSKKLLDEWPDAPEPEGEFPEELAESNFMFTDYDECTRGKDCECAAGRNKARCRAKDCGWILPI